MNDFLCNLRNTIFGTGDIYIMGLRTRQQKALEIRDLLRQVNARVAELEEDGYEVSFKGKLRTFKGFIKDVIITKTTVL